MNRVQAPAVLAGMLLNGVKQDGYPSPTEMSLIEEIIPPQLLPRLSRFSWRGSPRTIDRASR